MSFEGPLLLTADHRLDDFDSGEGALDNWLLRRSLDNQRSGASRTWVVVSDENRVVAFYASATSAILRSRATSRAARNQPDELPAVLLARMAVDRAPSQAYGVYQVGTGGARIYRFVKQGPAAFNQPKVHKTLLQCGEDIFLNVAPFGGGITNLLGGLP